MTSAHERLLDLWLSRRPRTEEGLVAFVVPETGADCDPVALRAWASQYLPHWMVPSRIVVVPDFPRTSSGKVQREALVAPVRLGSSARDAVAPRTPVEARLVTMFAELLGAPPLSVHDDFFADLGGHSLVATQLASTIRNEWGVEFPLRHVFESPTVAGLAAHIECASTVVSRPAIAPRRASTT